MLGRRGHNTIVMKANGGWQETDRSINIGRWCGRGRETDISSHAKDTQIDCLCKGFLERKYKYTHKYILSAHVIIKSIFSSPIVPKNTEKPIDDPLCGWVGGNSDLLGSQKHHWGSLEHKNPKVFSYHSWIFNKYSNYIMSNCSRNANVINIFFERRKPWTFQTFYNPLKAFRAINHDSLQQFCERLTLLHPGTR